MLHTLDLPRDLRGALAACTEDASDVPARDRTYAGPERRRGLPAAQRRMAQVVDEIDYGLVVLTAEGRVCHANRAARRELDRNHPAPHPLQWVGPALQARHAQDVQPLHDALAAAAERGRRQLLKLGDEQDRITVAVVPLSELPGAPGGSALMVMGKRQVCEELTIEWFARSHGLTLAETTVVKGLCADLTPLEIARRQGVGLATIRTQIGSVRAKTQSGSIRALVRQVAMLPPLVSALQGRVSGTGLPERLRAVA